jgi:hypothetical protein
VWWLSDPGRVQHLRLAAAAGLLPEGGNDFSSLAFESDCQVRLVMAKPLPAARPIVAQVPTKKPDCAQLAPLPNVDQFMAKKLG